MRRPRTPIGDPRLENLALISRLLDQAFRVPGTRWRFGVEALVGLLPGLGDVLGSLVGAYGVWLSRQLGAPASIQARMLLNLGIDALVGAIPLAGDLFDFAFKAHARNYTLLSSWLAAPHETRRSSNAFLAAIILGLLVIMSATISIGVASVRWRHAMSS